MTELDFIKKSIDELVKKFPQTRVRYENHELSNTHFIEVVPNNVYRLNNEYQKWEENIVFQFIEKYPNQNICFISDNALVGIENVDYDVKGHFYDLLNLYNNQKYNIVEVIEIASSDGNSNFKPILFDSNLSTLNQVSKAKFNVSNGEDLYNLPLQPNYFTVGTAIAKAGNTQYAMAA